MKNLLIGLLLLTSVSVMAETMKSDCEAANTNENIRSFAGQAQEVVSALAPNKKLECEVGLVNLSTNKTLSSQVYSLNYFGIRFNSGTSFYVEKTKKRLLQEPLVLSEIIIKRQLVNEGTSGYAIFRFSRISQPKRSIQATEETLGEEIALKAGEEKFEKIDSNYGIRINCSMKDREFKLELRDEAYSGLPWEEQTKKK